MSKQRKILYSITSGVIAFIADIACQKAMASDKESKIDWKRTAKFTIMNLVLVGLTLHYWYGFLKDTRNDYFIRSLSCCM